MSLSRLALRLAAIEALCPAATVAAGPYPTLAGPRVDDSRVDLVAAAQSAADLDAALEQLEGKPLLVVYTEEQRTEPYGEPKYPARETVCTLVVEAMIATKGVLVFDGPEGPETLGTLDAPVTDRQHEATLDMLEAQVRFLFDRATRAPSAALFRQIAWEVRSIHSDPQRAADRSTRLASRTVKFHVKVRSESYPEAAGGVPPTGLDALPEPLATVARALPADSSGGKLLAALVAAVPVLTQVPAPVAAGGLAGIFLQVPLDRAPDPSGADDSADVTGFVPAPSN